MWQNDTSRAEKSSRMSRLSSTRQAFSARHTLKGDRELFRELLGERCSMRFCTSKFITDIWCKTLVFQTIFQEMSSVNLEV